MIRQKQQQLRESIIRAVEEHFCGDDPERESLSRFIPELDRLLRAQGVEEVSAEEKTVTILLSDLRGFTAISESCPAKELIALLNRYFARMSEIIVAHGGAIDKFMGDAILALFGVQEAGERDLQQAVACAVEMQCAMDEINREHREAGFPDIYMGIGINTGEVAAGSLGSDLHREYTVIGDEVNLASRIEAYSLRGQVLVSDKSRRLLGAAVETGDANEVYVKGKREPVKLYEVRALLEPERREVPRRDPRNSPRVQVSLPLHFQRVEGKRILPEKYDGEVMDISYSGMLIRLSEYLPPYSEIKINLSLSLMGGESAAVYAMVLRSGKRDGVYQSSLEFTGFGADAQVAIKHFIDRIIAGG
ncbi:MAG: adenylate/guanylate cyclase domain-containing protein [Sedimenticola sp.]